MNQEVVTTFPADANGDVVQLITGRLLERLTNVSTGASITANVSGPGRTTIHPDGSLTIELLGRSLWLFPAGVQTGPRAVIISGRTVATVSPTGQFTLISEGGHEEDVCAALS